MDDYLVMGPDGRQMLKSQFDAEQQKSYNTSRLNSLLSAPVAAGAYGALDQMNVDPRIRDSVTGGLAGLEGIAQGALGARGGMHSENMLNAKPKTNISRTPGPAAVPPRADYGLNQEDWQEAGHATPHKFNKFDMSKVGTGEGKFIPSLIGEYGHGMYLSTSDKTIDSYYNSIADGLAGGDGAEGRPTMYKKRVAIPTDDKLLNRDKPDVAQQPEPVRQKLTDAKLIRKDDDDGRTYPGSLDSLIYKLGGQSRYTSSALEDAGIPGLKYEGLYQKTHGVQGKNVSNYVMWDESKMRPLRHDIPAHPPLVRERHRSTPDDDKPARIPDSVIEYDPELDGPDTPAEQPKWPIFTKYLQDAKDTFDKAVAAKGKPSQFTGPPGKFKVPKSMHDEGADEFMKVEKPYAPQSIADSVEDPTAGIPSFYDQLTGKTDWHAMKTYTAEHHPSDAAAMWSKTMKMQDQGLIHNAVAPPLTTEQLKQQSDEFFAKPKAATSMTALPDGAAPESSPWHAPTPMYNDFMGSGYAPVSGLPETEDAWKAWQQAGMPKSKGKK